MNVNSKWVTGAALTILLCSFSAEAGPKPLPPMTAYAPAYLAVVDGARFSQPEYFRLLASDGLRQADPQTLFALIQKASAGGETYKALYLSWLFTEIKPELAGGWTNRGAIAQSLGLDDEARACAERAADVSAAAKPIPPTLLPERIKARPKTLHDWAAAIALVSESLAFRSGGNSFVAIKDSVSGVALSGIDRNDLERGASPYVIPEPLLLEHIASNMVQIVDAKPMSYRTMSTGKLIGGLLLGGLAAYAGVTPGVNVASLSPMMQLSGDLTAQAMKIPSSYSGGEYSVRTFTPAISVQKHAPKSSGKYHAVDTPLPLLWASGGSMTPAIHARFISNDANSKVRKLTGSDLESATDVHGRRVPPLRVPKLARICLFSDCSPAVTLFEVMFARDDLARLAPALEASLPDLSMWIEDYTDREPDLRLNEGVGEKNYDTFIAGYDDKGTVYTCEQGPASWLVPAAARR